jgi:hypothetical protein
VECCYGRFFLASRVLRDRSLYLRNIGRMQVIGLSTGWSVVFTSLRDLLSVCPSFSLPDGALATYDSCLERTPPDGRVSSLISSMFSKYSVLSQPLCWWFPIRVPWPGAIRANSDNLMQKMVRLHRPMQLNIDNSVPTAGVWRSWA